MKKISSLLTKLSVSFICCLITVSLIVPKSLNAEVSNEDICDLILKKQYVLLSDEIIMDVLSGDVWGIFQDIFNGTMSYKTWKDTTNACEVDPDGSHGGHGGTIPNKVWYTVLNDTENDLKNGSNYNYYTNSNYSTTNNYSVVNTTTNNISYTYENTAYNYYYDVNNSYYDITNNSYNYYLSQNNYLTTVNNYNNTTIIDNGSNRVLYYRLPDGSNSLNMTEEIALNGYKTSLSVKSYDNTYDSNDLVALYHFDGNELDSAYPTSTTLNFTRNSIQYIGSNTPFNESLALYGDSIISVNKSNKFTSFRFNPIFNQNWSLSINGSDLGSAVLDYETFTHYDEFYNRYFSSSDLSDYIIYDESLNKYYCSEFGNVQYVSSSFGYIGGSGNDVILNLANKYDSPSVYFDTLNNINYVYEYDDNTSVLFNPTYLKASKSSSTLDWFSDAYYQFAENTGSGYFIYALSESDYNLIYQFLSVKPSNKTVVSYSSSYFNGPNVRFTSAYISGFKGYRYPLTSSATNRSYNYVNQFFIDTESAVDLVNFNMWNYLTVNIDGSVYINGNDTGIDVDNTQDLIISIDGDSITYVDELALFNSNRNNYSPFYPYSSNIVYSVPEYYEYLEVSGIKYNNQSNKFSSFNNVGFDSVVFNNDYDVTLTATRSQCKFFYFRPLDGHKYYLRITVYNVSKDGTYNLLEYQSSDGTWNNRVNGNGNGTYSYVTNGDGGSSSSFGLISLWSANWGNQTISASFKDPMFIDLTMMFGSGNEPDKEWCDNNLYFITYNPNPDVSENPFDISTGYTYIKQIPTGLAKNNEILIQSIIPVNSWKIGGYRSSNPSNGDVFCNVDDLGYITSVQQYNGLDWVEVTAGLYNEYMGMWISALGFNIFNQNWEYTEYKYLNDGGSDSWLVRFLSDKFRDTDNILTNILKQVGLINPNIQVNQELNNDYNNVINNYNINPYDELNNRFNDINEYNNRIDLTAPEFNIDSDSMLQAQELKQIPEEIVDGFVDLKIGYLLFIPLIICIVRLIL